MVTANQDLWCCDKNEAMRVSYSTYHWRSHLSSIIFMRWTRSLDLVCKLSCCRRPNVCFLGGGHDHVNHVVVGFTQKYEVETKLTFS
jgi:hypothetical protein